ncbi:MAG: hypothetical protein D6714_18535, partial [Bacteroidetes bacterium]
IIWLLAGLMVGFSFFGCKKDGETAVGDNAVRMEKPAELGMSSDSLEAAVQQKGIEAIEASKSELVEEATQTIDVVYEALAALEKGDTTAAIDALERGTGKIEVLLTREPDLALVPLKVQVQMYDLISDLETIKKIKKAARKALKEDHFQLVRETLSDFASEIEITSLMLPLKTFPPTLTAAAALVHEGKTDAAKAAIYSALNTLVIEKQHIPLPILRAQVLIDNAKKLSANKDEKSKYDVLYLLDNAKYQLMLAEELGYGKRDKEYGALNDDIKALKKAVEKDEDISAKIDSLINRIAKFKDRIVAKTE